MKISVTLKKWEFVFVLLTLFLITGFYSVAAQSGDCKPFDFNLAAEYQVGPNTFSFTSVDLNGDGNVDVITSNYNVDSISVLFGDGAGGFAPPLNFPSGVKADIIVTGDLNRDGKPDLVAVPSYGTQITVLLNNGQGGFQTPMVSTISVLLTEYYEIKIADFSGDGNPDVVGITKEKLNFFLGNGQGGLTLNTSLNYEGFRSHLAVGNSNNDNLADLAITTLGNSSAPWEIDIVLGKQGGGFVINNFYELREPPSGIDVGDFNGDNLTDIVISADYPYQNSTPQTYFLQPWFGNGNGGFSPGVKVQMPSVNSGVVAGDFNGDGKLDLATKLVSTIAVVNGVGDGTFQNQTYWAAPSARAVLSADANRDGKKDLLLLHTESPNSLITVLLSDNFNGFKAQRAFLRGGTDLAAADFNNDAYKDFISATDTGFSSNSEVLIALNDKNGGLLSDSGIETPKALTDIEVGDFNGDGQKDVVTAHSDNARVLSVFLGNGTGKLGTPVTTQFTAGIQNIIVMDFNADTKNDLFVLDSNGRGYSLISNGDGTFKNTANPTVTLPGFYALLDKEDFNRDGKADLVISNGLALTLWLGDGSGNFSQSDSQPIAANASGLAIGDFNGDHNLDVVGIKSGSNTTLTRFFGNGNGTFGIGATQTIDGQSSQGVISADFNSDGFDDIAYTSTNIRGDLVVIPSAAQSPFWETPIFFQVGGLGVPTSGSFSTIIAADYNNDNKIDIGFSNNYRVKGVIYNTNGQKPCVSVSDVTVSEGNAENVTATFTVKLSAPSLQDVRVNYTIEAKTATTGTDFQNAAGRLLIPAGQSSAIIQIVVNGDLLDEFDENFVLHLTSPDNAALLKADAVGTISDNDAEPMLTISDATLVEGFSQSTGFRVALSAPSGKPISFRYATADGTSTANKDYFTETGTLNIAPGQTSVSIFVTVVGDTIYERDETFFLNLTQSVNATIADGQAIVTITNDDPIPTLVFFANVVIEGDTGMTTATANLQLSNPTYLPVTFNVLTSDGTAVAGIDYVASDSALTIAPEQLSATGSIQVFGDTVNEPNKSFNVNVYNLANASITATQFQLFIIDDESVSNDFDGDGKTDLAVFRPSNGTWYFLNSSNGGFTFRQYGLSADVPTSGDYNNDGRTDVTVWRPSSGIWYSTIANRTQQWGQGGDIPVGSDYDNDGKIDVAVFRPTTQTWYIQLSSTGAYKFVQWGLSTDTPVPADYDGDGKTDIAVYRPSNGTWYVQRSSDNGFSFSQWGIQTDKPVPADYDGDGKADFAVYRPNIGTWYVSRSTDNGLTTFQWGTAGDKPVPGNYDGDAKTDFAVYRDGVWWIWQSSTNNYVSKQFGLPDDIPIPFVSGN